MKRFTSLLLILCILFSLGACKARNEESDIVIDTSENAAGENAEVSADDYVIQSDCGVTNDDPSDAEEIQRSDAIGIGIDESDTEYYPTDEEKLAYFEKIHPGCTVSVDHNDIYSIINENVSIDEFKTEKLLQRQPDDPWSREDVEDWMEVDCIEYTIIFRGRKTGNTIQKASYAAWQLPATPYGACTLVEMEVTEAYYGKVKEGDKVWVSDNYGVVYENDKYRLDISNEAHISGMFANEYVIHASKTFIPTVPDIENEYRIDFFALPLDREYAPLDTWPGPGVDYSVYEKYILKKDTALNREHEMEKQKRKNEQIVSAVEDIGKFDKLYPELYDIAKDIKSANYELTKRQLALIEDSLQRYGEK